MHADDEDEGKASAARRCWRVNADDPQPDPLAERI